MKKYHHCVKFTYPLSFQTRIPKVDQHTGGKWLINILMSITVEIHRTLDDQISLAKASFSGTGSDTRQAEQYYFECLIEVFIIWQLTEHITSQLPVSITLHVNAFMNHYSTYNQECHSIVTTSRQ